MGISRAANPDWPGWIVLDHGRGVCPSGFDPSSVDGVTGGCTDLRRLVRSFYLHHYWHGVFADTMPWPLSVVVFDSAVVHGRNRAVRMLQEALNNLYGFRKLEVDGIFRRDSRNALAVILSRHEWYLRTLVAEVLRIRQGYCDLVACGDRQAMPVCRQRALALRRLAERCFEDDVFVMPADTSGLGLAC
ncbi:hypothetical protein DSECCO2_369410 [anaerobic digester metagenome]